MKVYNVAEFYPGQVTIDDFLNEMGIFKETEIPIVVLDEFNEIDDEDTSILGSKPIKQVANQKVF